VILIRLAAFISLQPWNPDVESSAILISDQKSYHDLAVSILENGYGQQAYWMPGWPAYIAVIYSLFGIKPWLVILFNTFPGVITIFVFYHAVKRLFGDKIALVASVLLAFDPHQIIYGQFLYSENLFLPVMMLFLYFFIRFIDGKKLQDLIISGLFAGSLVYIRSAALYLPLMPLVILPLVISGSAFDRFKKLLIFSFVVFLVQTPLSLKNYIEQGRWKPTANGGYNLLFIYAGSVYMNQLGYSQPEANKLLVEKVNAITGGKQLNQFEFEEVANDVAIDIIKQYPLEYLQNHFSGCVNIYTSLSTYNLATILGAEKNTILNPEKYGNSHIGMASDFVQNKPPVILMLGVMLGFLLLLQYSLGITGIYVLLKGRNWPGLIMPLSFIIYFTLVTGVLGSSARFKLPITPYYLIFSAIGYNYIKNYFSHKKQTG